MGFESVEGLLRVTFGQGEGDVGLRGVGDRQVLDDHVDVGADLGDDGEDAGGDAGAVRHVGDGDLVLGAVVSDTGDDGLFHGVFLGRLQGCVGHEALEFRVCGGVGDPGAVLFGERGAHVQGDPVAAREFDGAQVEDLGAVRGHFQGFFLGEGAQAVGLGDDARVGGEEAVDVRVDFAHVGVEGRGEGDGGRVGTSAAQRRHVVVLGDALEAGDNGDLAVLDGAGDALGDHADDLCGTEMAVRFDAGLRAGVGAGFDAEFVDSHREEGHRDALAGRQEDIHFALGRGVREGCGRVEQVVGRVTHRRYDDNDAVSRVVRVHDAPGDALHGFGISDGRTAVLLHDQCH